MSKENQRFSICYYLPNGNVFIHLPNNRMANQTKSTNVTPAYLVAYNFLLSFLLVFVLWIKSSELNLINETKWSKDQI